MERDPAPRPTIPLIVTFVWGTLLIPGLLSLLFTPMMFDAPGSASNPMTYLMILFVLSFPVLCIISLIGTWVVFNVQTRSPEKSLAAPQIVVACLPLVPIGIWIVQFIFTIGTQPWGLHTTVIQH
ncbi:MAG TPA: hypothetical protein VEW74_04055 [Candidatus Nitrosotalea sp.]|nr:hypothetical protein [Candidatus Nitrosotalea sp.]